MKVGDRVQVRNSKSINHGNVGRIVEIDNGHIEGFHQRPYKVRFTKTQFGELSGWYEAKELKKA